MKTFCMTIGQQLKVSQEIGADNGRQNVSDSESPRKTAA